MLALLLLTTTTTGGAKGGPDSRRGKFACVKADAELRRWRDVESVDLKRRQLSNLTFDGRVVATMDLLDPKRYFSLIKNASGVWWFVAKDGEYPSCKTESRTLVWRNCGSNLDCFAARRSRPDASHSSPSIHHNAALMVLGSEVVGVGGYFKRRKRDLRDEDAPPKNELVRTFRVTDSIDVLGTVEGMSYWDAPGACIERRWNYAGHCNFDGRFSLVDATSTVLLYARANLVYGRGGRHVTVTELDVSAFPNVRRTSNASLLQFLPSSPEERADFDLSNETLAAVRANVYFAAVNRNPANPRTYLGLFPVSVYDPDRVAIVAAVSLDGRTFSPPLPLIRSFGVMGESNDHPVDGLFFDEAADRAFFYVHAGVPGTLREVCAVEQATEKYKGPKHLLVNASLYGRRYFDKIPRSQLLRFEFHMHRLRRYTRHATALLLQHHERHPYHLHRGAHSSPRGGWAAH